MTEHLHFAVHRHDVKEIHYQLDKGLDIESIAGDGNTALCTAALLGDSNSVEALIERGAKINTKCENGNTAILLASRAGRINIIKLLIDKGADIENISGLGGNPLLLAALSLELDTMQYLIEKGADVNATSDDGISPLIIVTALGSLKGMKLLTDRGADVNGKSSNTILHVSAKYGWVNGMKFSLERGVKLDQTDSTGKTALYHTVPFGHIDAMEFLINRGAQINTKDNRGTTLLEYAIEKNKPEMVKLLQSRGESTPVTQSSGIIGELDDAHRVIVELRRNLSAKNADYDTLARKIESREQELQQELVNCRSKLERTPIGEDLSVYTIDDSYLEKWTDGDDLLGEGAFGTVSKALYYGTPVAIKVMKEQDDSLMMEVSNLTRLHHPNIVSIIAYDDLRIIMPLSDGDASKIDSIEELIIVARDTMRGLVYMHAHVKCFMHGDIKPENILVTRGSNGKIIKAILGDIGLSRTCDTDNGRSEAFMGTPGYMPIGPATPYSDLHALAVSLMRAYLTDIGGPISDEFVDGGYDGNALESVVKMPEDFQIPLMKMLKAYDTPELSLEMVYPFVTDLSNTFNNINQ